MLSGLRATIVVCMMVWVGSSRSWAASDDADVVQVAPHGKVNWSTRTIAANGSGPPSLKAPNVAVARLGAERAAKADAVRNIVEAVRLMNLQGKDVAGSTLDAGPELKGRLEALLKDFKTLDTRYFADGGVDLLVEFPVDGALSQLLLGLPVGVLADEPVQPATEQTGLVVNAKGLKAQPVLSPRLVGEDGVELYGVTAVLREPLTQRGVAAYTRSLDGALKDARVIDKPLIVRALKIADSGPGDLVIAAADAAKLAALKPLLSQAKVVIVLD